MIKVIRLPIPRILQKKAIEWRNSLLACHSEIERERVRRKYRHKEIKTALLEMFHGKCAYCESRIVHVDFGHIEHYRPKSGKNGRPDLTFEWPNLLLACGVCNGGEYKSDRFPEADQGGVILNPCDDDPSEHLEFCYDSAARLASVYGRTARGTLTEHLLGLNRTALRAYRSAQIQRLIALARFAGQDPEAANLLDDAQQAQAEYAAFARALFQGQPS